MDAAWRGSGATHDRFIGWNSPLREKNLPLIVTALGSSSCPGTRSRTSARVERESPGAPQPIKNMAVVRYCGYMAQSDFGTIRQESIGPREVQYVVNHQRAWVNCGAKSVLSPWKVLNAAPITHTSEAG